MGFPITVNGRVWTEAEFQNGDIGKNLGPFLNDCLVDFTSKFYGTSTSTVTPAKTGVTFTTQPGLFFRAGHTVRMTPVVDEVLYMESYMVGHVRSYDTATGELVVGVASLSGDAVARSSWVISLSGMMLGQVNTPAFIEEGGSAGTTNDAAREACGIRLPDSYRCPYMEDFIRYRKSISTANNDDLVHSDGLTLKVTGSAVIAQDGNLNGNDFSSGKGIITEDRPGILVLSLGNAQSLAYVQVPISVRPGAAGTQKFVSSAAVYFGGAKFPNNPAKFKVGIVGSASLAAAVIDRNTGTVRGEFRTSLNVANATVVTGTKQLNSDYWYTFSVNAEPNWVIRIYQHIGLETTLFETLSPGIAPEDGSAATGSFEVSLETAATVTGSNTPYALVDYIHYERQL